MLSHHSPQYNVPSNALHDMSRRVIRFSVFCLAWSILIWVSPGSPSQAEARSNKLKLDFKSAQGGMQIAFSSHGQAVPAEQISVGLDKPNRLRFTVDGGYRCRKGYIKKLRIPGLKAVFVYPAKKVKGRCYLLVRMTRKIAPELVSAMRMSQSEDSTMANFSWSAPPELPKEEKTSAQDAQDQV